MQQAEAIADGRANELLASLYLNLGEAYLAVGNPVEAASAAALAYASLAHLSRNGYQGFVARGIERQARFHDFNTALIATMDERDYIIRG